MCDCFHLAFPNWHAASETGGSRRLRGPEPGAEDDSVCDEPLKLTEGERPRPQGSSPVEEYPETEKYIDGDKEFEAEHDPHRKSGSGKKTKKSGLGSMFEKRSTPKMSKLKEVHSPESVIVKTTKDGCAEGLVYGGGAKEGIFIKEVVPESPASKSLGLKEGDQVLSATVYFDNMPYEDAIQILDHAQAYTVKLCLKRKPDITETEPVVESDIIPEETLVAPEMRDHGKTKRRGDARISWPKFSSFGKGRKSRFTRSHSSSEADEQRKLELSPTTSDTESPIKSQDALKGKKRHKMKLSALTKSGRISPSEERCLESPSGETTEDLSLDQNYEKLTEPQAAQHKVELITITDSTLKTTDLTVALADKESLSGMKSPDGKKKKKERSEFKIKILGKDKSHKKDAKVKPSPKRLKTLGASVEIADQPENKISDVIQSSESHSILQGDQLKIDPNNEIISSENSRVISTKSVTSQVEMSVPKVEMDVDVTFIGKSPQKSEEKIKTAEEIKQKEDTMTGPTFKLPKIGSGDIATDGTIQKINANVEDCTIKIEQRTTEGTEVKDPYEQLSSRTQLPKREEIEIPGMEDISLRIKTKGFKEPKAGLSGQYEELQAEAVQLSIDVDRVKEAVSKLPGYKLPEVDTSGVPIPQEITVIDANAQRISMKTPTKVVDTKTKHETPDISKTTMKLPKITPGDSTSEGLLLETRVDLKTTEMKHKTTVYKREDIVIPGIESAQEVTILQAKDTEKTLGTEDAQAAYESTATVSPKESDRKSRKAKITTSGFGIGKPEVKIPDGGIHLPKQNISEQKDGTLKGEGTIVTQEVETGTRRDMGQIGGVISDVKIPGIDGIEYIDSVGGSPAEKDGGILLTGFGVNPDAAKPNTDIYIPEIVGEVKDIDAEGHTMKLPKFEEVTTDISVNVSHADEDINIDRKKIKKTVREGKGGKFKMPHINISMPKVKGLKIDLTLTKKDVKVALPEAKAEVKLPEVPEVDITSGKKDVCIPKGTMEVEKPELELKPLQTDGELDGKGAKLKTGKLEVTMPKVKGKLRFPMKDGDVPEVTSNMEIPQDPNIYVDIRRPESQVDIDVQGGKFKMPKFGVSLPEVKGPEIEVGSSKKVAKVTLPEAKTELQPPDVGHLEPCVKTDIKAPELAVHQLDVEKSLSEFKIPKLKLPKFGIKSPKVSVNVPDKDRDVKIDGAYINIPEKGFAVNTESPSVDFQSSSLDMKGPEQEGKGTKFEMPHFDLSIPKVKGPKLDFSISKNKVDATLPEANANVTFPEVDLGGVNASLPDNKMEVPENKVEVELPEHPVTMKTPECEVEMDAHSGKFKTSKFGIKLPKLKGPQFDSSLAKEDEHSKLSETKADIKLPDVDLGKVVVSIPEARIEVKKPDVEMPSLNIQGEVDGEGGRLKKTKFGMKLPKIEAPEFDFSSQKIDTDAALPQTKAEVKLRDAPKMDRHATIREPDMDKGIKIAGGAIQILEEDLRVNITATSIETDGPSIYMKTKGTEAEGKGMKFKMPSLSISMPQVKRPEIDLSLSTKDADVTRPEAKAEVKVPEVELKEPSAEIEMKAPGIKVATESTEGLPSQFKVPTLRLPKFGITIPSAAIEMPDMDKDVKIDVADIKIPEEVLRVDIAASSIKTEGPSIHMKTKGTADEGKGMKFQMPSLSFSVPQVKGPEIDLSLSTKDADVTLPEAKAEVKVPHVELKEPSAEVEMKAPGIMVATESTEGSPSQFKVPTLRLPKFGITTSSATIEMPDKDKDVKIGGAYIQIPEKTLRVEIAVPSIETEGPSMHMKTKGTADEGKEMKFKMPSLSFSAPQVKRPEIDLSLSKKDVDVILPEAKAEVKVPDVELKQPSAEVEIKAPWIKFTTESTERSPSQFKVPSLKLPKFGIITPSANIEMPDMDKDIKIDGADIKIPEETLSVDIAAPSIETEGPSIHMKTKGTADEGKGMKFKMPSFSFSAPQVKRPEIDLSLSKKVVDVTLPEAKAEVKVPDVELKQPSAEVEIKAPWIKFTTESTERSPSQFKVPSLKLPKFGIITPSANIEMPDMDKDIKIDGADIKIPEETLSVDIAAPSIETEGPSIHMKTKGTADEGKGMKFKMPSFSFSAPQVKRPDIDLSLSKKVVDVTLPEAKAEVKVPDVELKEPSAEVDIKAPGIMVATEITEGSPSKFKMPTFKLPKFGVGTPSATIKMPDMDKDVKIDGADIKIPEETLSVDIAATSIETEGPSIHLKTKGNEDEGKGMRFKMPSLRFSAPQVKRPEIDLSLSKKDVDVTLPEAKAEVRVPDVELKQPSAEVEIKAPEIKVATTTTEGSPSKFKMPTFKLPKFGVGTRSASVEMPDMNKDVEIDGGDIKIPEEILSVDIAAPSIETEGPSIHTKTKGTADEGKGMKFKMPSLSFSVPQVKGPEIDLSLSTKNVDVTLPEAKAEVKVPDVELKEPPAEVEIKAPWIKFTTESTEGSPSQFKVPSLKLPKFGIITPSATIEIPDMDKDIKIDGADIKIPEETLSVEIAAPSIETEGPSIHMKTKGTEDEGKGMKFKMPSLRFSAPQIKRPEIDLSLATKDVDVTLPEAKAEVKVPDVELKEPPAEVDFKAPGIKVATESTEGSPSQFKMPSFKLPKFGVGTRSASVEMPDMDKNVKIDRADIKIPEETLSVEIAAPSIETEGPSIHMKTKGTADEVKGMKFQMPSLSFSATQVKRREIDLSLSKKDVDVTLPEAKAEVKVPDFELKDPSAEVEIKAPEIKISTKNTEGSPSKFKMPSFKLPKFGVGTRSASVEMPDIDKDVKIDGGDIKIPEEVLSVEIAAPSIETEGPSIHMKTKGTTDEGRGMKFKMPSLSFSAPQVKRPEIDLSLSKKDVDVTLPEAKAEVKVPDVELKQPSAEVDFKAPGIKAATESTEGSPSKFKMPSFKLPKFGVGSRSASVEIPDMDKNVKIDGGDIKIPEEILSVEIAAPSIETEGPSIHMKTKGTADEGKGMKFKMPSLSFSAPQVKGPEIDLSLSTKDVDVTLPEAKAEVKVPDVELKQPSAEVEIKAPWIKFTTESTEGSPSQFKVPSLKLPKFGIITPSATIEMPDMNKDIKIDGGDIKIPEETLSVEIAAPSIKTKGPSIHMKTKGTEDEGKGMKFKMPSLRFSAPQVKRPDIDLSLSKKDVDVTLPEAKAEVKVPDFELEEPSAEVEIKTPGIKAATESTEGSPSKFKMPSFKLPKFGVGTRSASVEMPDMDKDVKIDGGDIKIPDEVLSVDIAAPSIETEGPSIHMKTKGTEDEGKGMKFKMPSLSFSAPQVKRREIDLSLSKKDVDVTLPEAKAEVRIPDVDLKQPSAEVEIKAPEIKVALKNTEGSPSKFKMPTFKLPKFGLGTTSASVDMPDMDKDVKIDGGDIKIPEETLSVDIAAPSIETEGPSIHTKTKGTADEGKGMKFKMPSLSFSAPQVKRPEIDSSLSKKDVDVTLPEAKAEVKVPDVELREPSAEVEMKAPEIKIATKNTEGSPSKFKMPSFKLPKFGVGTASASVEMPDMDKDVKIDGADIKIPEEVLSVDIAAPSIETEGPSVQMKTKGTEHEGKGMKFKMPSLSFSAPQVKRPEIDSSVSKKDVDVTIPQVEAEVKLPNVKVKEPEGTISEPDVPTVEVEAKLKRPNWTFPKFAFSKTSDKVPDVDLNLETAKVDITSPEAKREVCLADVDVQGYLEGISTKEPSAVELDANLKKSKFSLPKFSFSKSNVKAPEVSAELPQVDVSLSEGEVKVIQPRMEINAPDLEAEHDGQGSKFTLPKFTFKQSKAKGQDEDLKVSQRDVDIALPGFKAVVRLPEVEEDDTVNAKGTEMSRTETVNAGPESPSKFKLPSFKMPKLSFSRANTEDENAPVETEYKQHQPEMEVELQGQSKSPEMTMTSFGEIFKNFEVEYDVRKTDKGEEILEPLRQIQETDEKSGIQFEPKERETNTKQDVNKSPERTGWFKFPRFGLDAQSEPAKTSERRDTVDEEISPNCSVQSSDAFADISSAMTSEYVGLSLSSPTKVTVKYSDPNAARGLEEMHSNIVSTSTTRTEVISVPEKVTILSSGVSSSSEDTVRLESGKIHVIRSKMQATPGARQANLPSAAQIQSAGGLPPKSGADETASWTVQESQGGKRTIYERQSVRETSSGGSESKKTVVITKQITRIGTFESSEPISGETASSIQRLRDTVHSEKMRFFDKDEK